MRHTLNPRYLVAAAAIFLSAACGSVTSTQPDVAAETPAYRWEDDLRQRLAVDFSATEEQVTEYIRRYIPDLTAAQMRAWEASGALECMVIDGTRHYFHAAARNLFRIDPQCRAIKQAADGVEHSSSERANLKNIPEIISAATDDAPIAAPKRMRVTYTLTVAADAVPAGETIRCWLPYPRRDVARQSDVQLLSTSEQNYTIAPDECRHSTLYMERKAVAGEPAIFSETFEYTSAGERHDLQSIESLPYDTTSAIYREYTSERERHIRFTPRLRALAARIAGDAATPAQKAERIFRYICEHYPWASAREYSTIDNIPEYVVDNGHGDCGQVSLLFITLCRISGIPARFQSGFMMHPGAWNLHDWAEIYIEGTGWVPVDQSFGIPDYARSDAERRFFLGGIDSWRMVVNNDYGMPLHPAKRYPRSETVDFQRGEVEWRGGNLYFTQWSYDMQIEYLDN